MPWVSPLKKITLKIAASRFNTRTRFASYGLRLTEENDLPLTRRELPGKSPPMPSGNIIADCFRRPFTGRIEFLLWSKPRMGQAPGIVRPVALDEMTVEEDGRQKDASFSLTEDECQTLYNNLTRMGFRATDKSEEAGALRAMNDHLQDMRRLVFKDKLKEK